MTKPKSSIHMPMNGRLIKMRMTPPRKHSVPLSFCFRAKNATVRCGPMMRVSPAMKSIYRVRRLVWFPAYRKTDVSYGKKTTVKEQEDTENHEQCPECRQGDANFCTFVSRTFCCTLQSILLWESVNQTILQTTATAHETPRPIAS